MEEYQSGPRSPATGTYVAGSALKKSRPPILKRTSHTTTNTLSSALLGSPRKERVTLETSQADESMAGCFLQYCAMCEKQISTPCNSILYCSEACRRKDTNKPLSAANLSSGILSPPMSPTGSRSILPPRTSTGVSLNTETSAIRIPTDNHSFKSDLDPTEWKPKSMRADRPTSSRYQSEAFRYLSSFHRAISKNHDTNGNNDNPNDIRIEVTNMSSIAATAPTTPSLGNTPTTAASSWSLSTSAEYAGPGHERYDTVLRPLMPRHNRWYSTSVIGVNGMDLVTPHIPPPPPTTLYSKKDISVDSHKAQGGLGAFFGDHAD